MRNLTLLLVFALAVTLIGACDSSPNNDTDPDPAPPDSTGQQNPDPTTLRGWADSAGVNIGTAVADNPLRTEDQYAEVLTREFNQVTPENVMKWNTIHPSRDSYNFGPGDTLVDTAEANDMDVHGHTLVWHSQNPSWLEDNSWSEDTLKTIMEDHIRTVVNHYGDRVQEWDVVNEAIGDGGSRRPTIWQNTIGDEYIAEAFRIADDANPDATLYYNDYGITGLNNKSDGVYDLVRNLVEQEVPIDAVGLQAHLSTDGGAPSLEELSENIQRFNELGLEVGITELDVAIPIGDGEPTDEQLQTQADIYERMLTACMEADDCSNFTMWGFTDRHSWIPNFSDGEDGAALIFDESYDYKPAYNALIRVLN